MYEKTPKLLLLCIMYLYIAKYHGNTSKKKVISEHSVLRTATLRMPTKQDLLPGFVSMSAKYLH